MLHARVALVALILLVVVGRLDIHDLLVDNVLLSLVLLHEHGFFDQSLLKGLVLHLDEAKASSSLSDPVSHHDGVGHRTKLAEVVDEVRL